MAQKHKLATRARRPKLGLVCMTIGPEIRFRTVTRARFLAMPPHEQAPKLRSLYAENLQRLFGALTFCASHKIRLYRATSGLFPLIEHPVGAKVLLEMGSRLAPFGAEAERLGVRVVMHPDQFVVLSSLSPHVVQQSIGIMERHAHVFDLLKLPRSSWSALILHGGKSGQAEALVKVIASLPESIRTRLVLENDEYAYSAAEILDVCRRASVPMVFDAHHHVIKEKLKSYEDPSIAKMLREAKTTWPNPAWQLTHISNGQVAFADPRHSQLITTLPSALYAAPWIEVEAKGKEEAIYQLRLNFPNLN